MSVIAAAAVPHPPLIVPEVGHGEEKKIQTTIDAYREVMRRAAALKPDTIVLTSPHSIMYSDYFHISPGARSFGDLGQFRAPQVSVSADYDTEFVKELCCKAEEEKIPAGTLGEQSKTLDHATILPLHYLNEYYTGYKLVRIGLSGLSPLMHYRLGQCIAETSEKLGKRVVFIASGDLSHKLKEDGPYGYAPQGPEFDRMITEDFSSGDFLKILSIDQSFADAAAECGLRSFQVMAGAFDRKDVSHELLSYEGPFGVGYGVAWFEAKGDDPDRCFGRILKENHEKELAAIKDAEDPYVQLARYSLETYVRTGKKAALPEHLPEEMTNRRAGVFVSIKSNGNLRGCIGTIAATTGSIAEEILQNAVSACSKDPRFDPVEESELHDLVYDVDVLGPSESIDSEDMLDVKRYGVIVENGMRRGLLLPDLEGVDTVAQQITIARKKAGIMAGEPVRLKRFEVIRHV